MKKLLNFFIAIIPAIILSLVAYLLTSFVMLDVDFRNWSKTARCLFVPLLFLSWWISYVIIEFANSLNIKEDKPKVMKLKQNTDIFNP